jgi:hypothetical protein
MTSNVGGTGAWVSGFAGLFPGTETRINESGTIDWVRPELSYYFDQYSLIHDCLAGEQSIKRAGMRYLPMPNAHDQSIENKERYIGYKTRAVFYGVTERTLEGLIGEVFNVDPTVKVPTQLDAVVKDADGSGVPLVQLAQETESDVLSYGRAGLFIDYPRTDGKAVSVLDIESGDIRPTINHYKPWNVINWRVQKVGGKSVLTFVVLREEYEMPVGDFGVAISYQYRVLSLIDGIYKQEIYIPAESGALTIDPTKTVLPVDASGNNLTYIPFMFVGAKWNGHKVNKPPLYSLASLNVAHYRNSADYEDSCYIVGQPTPVATGLTQNWVDTVLKGEFKLGSRGMVPLPEGADFKLVSATENSMIKEAMDQKERQMVALGAKLVEQTTVQRTATEASLETSSEVSVLATITKNVSAAYKFALEVCALFTGATTVAADANQKINSGIQFDLNTEFSLSDASPEEINTVIKSWQSEAISWTEMRGKLRKTGYATLDDAKAKQEIADELMQTIETNAAAGLDANGQPINNGNNNGFGA